MRGVVMYAPGDVRVQEREDAKIVEPTDAVIRVTAACICGSDLWPYRGIEPLNGPTPMGHEYIGIVEQVGDDVRNIKVGDYVGYVGVTHGVELDGLDLFFTGVHLHGGPAPDGRAARHQAAAHALRRSSPSPVGWSAEGQVVGNPGCRLPDLLPTTRTGGFRRNLPPPAFALLASWAATQEAEPEHRADTTHVHQQGAS